MPGTRRNRYNGRPTKKKLSQPQGGRRSNSTQDTVNPTVANIGGQPIILSDFIERESQPSITSYSSTLSDGQAAPPLPPPLCIADTLLDQTNVVTLYAEQQETSEQVSRDGNVETLAPACSPPSNEDVNNSAARSEEGPESTRGILHSQSPHINSTTIPMDSCNASICGHAPAERAPTHREVANIKLSVRKYFMVLFKDNKRLYERFGPGLRFRFEAHLREELPWIGSEAEWEDILGWTPLHTPESIKTTLVTPTRFRFPPGSYFNSSGAYRGLGIPRLWCDVLPRERNLKPREQEVQVDGHREPRDSTSDTVAESLTSTGHGRQAYQRQQGKQRSASSPRYQQGARAIGSGTCESQQPTDPDNTHTQRKGNFPTNPSSAAAYVPSCDSLAPEYVGPQDTKIPTPSVTLSSSQPSAPASTSVPTPITLTTPPDTRPQRMRSKYSIPIYAQSCLYPVITYSETPASSTLMITPSGTLAEDPEISRQETSSKVEVGTLEGLVTSFSELNPKFA